MFFPDCHFKILYILLDVATPPGDPTLAQQYCDRFHIDCIELAVAVWNIDHGNVPPTISDNRVSTSTCNM